MSKVDPDYVAHMLGEKERRERRAKQLPHAKELVANHIQLIAQLPRLTDLERHLLDVAEKAVWGAR